VLRYIAVTSAATAWVAAPVPVSENLLRPTKVAAGIQHAIDLAVVLRPLLDLVVIAIVRQQQIVGFFVGPVAHSETGAGVLQGAAGGVGAVGHFVDEVYKLLPTSFANEVLYRSP
jgi:hypothetical protein